MTNSFIETKAAETSQTEDKPMVLRKRIGSTTYEVFVHFSEEYTEKPEDIILRLIEHEVSKSA